jgi:hypothetical protein
VAERPRVPGGRKDRRRDETVCVVLDLPLGESGLAHPLPAVSLCLGRLEEARETPPNPPPLLNPAGGRLRAAGWPICCFMLRRDTEHFPSSLEAVWPTAARPLTTKSPTECGLRESLMRVNQHHQERARLPKQRCQRWTLLNPSVRRGPKCRKLSAVPSPLDLRPRSDSIRKECGGVQPSNTTSLARLRAHACSRHRKRGIVFCLRMPPSCTGAHPFSNQP